MPTKLKKGERIPMAAAHRKGPFHAEGGQFRANEARAAERKMEKTFVKKHGRGSTKAEMKGMIGKARQAIRRKHQLYN